jgi:hypothetical protein
MDPTEIIRQTTDVVGAGAALAGALKLTDIIKAMLGPAAAEIAERFRDNIRIYRYGRQLDCLKKAEMMAENAGFTPKAVPIKLLFPLLEGASLEDNETLHTMWAALLANAASPESTVRPGFIAILRQMSPDEAAMMNWVYRNREGDDDDDSTSSSTSSSYGVEDNSLVRAYYSLGFGPSSEQPEPEQVLQTIEEYLTCIGSLEAAQFLVYVHANGDIDPYYQLTPRGRAFIKACQAPAQKSR